MTDQIRPPLAPATDEPARLAALHLMSILDSAPEPAFDALAAVAQQTVRATVALISLVDADRLWFKASAGLDAAQVDREGAFCATVVERGATLVVNDARADPRFRDTALVVGEPHIRAYLGAPIYCDGQAVGVVCVIDRRARRWSAENACAVERFAEIAASLIEMRFNQLTALRNAEHLDAMVGAEQRFHTIYAAISEGVILQEASGLIVEANASARRILRMEGAGLPKVNALRPPWTLLDEKGCSLDPSDTPSAVAIRERRSVRGRVVGIDRGERDVCWLQVNVEPLFEAGPGSTVTHVVSTFTDITTMRAARQLNEASERSRRDLMQALPVPVYTTDEQGYLTFFNDAASAFWGRIPELGVDRWSGAFALYTLDGKLMPHHECPIAECLNTGRPVRDFQGIILRPDGSTAYFQPYPTPLLDTDGRVVGAVNMVVDISAHKEAAARQDQLITELEDAKAALSVAADNAESANRAKTTFLANMSHELRTPLNGVIGVVSALRVTALDDRQRDMVALVLDSARGLERILSDILDLTKVEADKLTIETVEIDLVALVSSACELMRVRADEKGLGFSVVIAPEAAGAYLGDGVRIRQVLSNLLSTAIKFTQAGEVSVQLDCRPASDPKDADLIVIQVADTGVGIDAEAATRLFERFEQADSSITRRFGGTGLGLPISRDLVRLMGGEVAALPRPGGGSLFEVRLPLRRADPGVVVAAEDFSPSVEAPRRGLRILVAEDHPTNRKVVEMLLAPLGFELSFVENGLEAVQAQARQPFDLVLMDIQMPVMDGLTAIRHIRATEAGGLRLPIAVLSANAGEDHRNEARAAGADLHIAKPVTLESLLDGISRAVALMAAPASVMEAFALTT